MKTAEPREDGPISEGGYDAETQEASARDTRKGRWDFLPCRITERGPFQGRTVEFLVPRSIDPRLLENRACRIEVEHRTRGDRVYANVAMLMNRQD